MLSELSVIAIIAQSLEVASKISAIVSATIIALIIPLVITLLISLILVIINSIHEQSTAKQTCSRTKQSTAACSESMLLLRLHLLLLLSVVRRLLSWISLSVTVGLLGRVTALIAAVLLRWRVALHALLWVTLLRRVALLRWA
jgi:hypothetical protein